MTANSGQEWTLNTKTSESPATLLWRDVKHGSFCPAGERTGVLRTIFQTNIATIWTRREIQLDKRNIKCAMTNYGDQFRSLT